MKKMLIIAGAAIILAACSSKAPVNEQDAKIEQLQEYKNEMHELKVKIEKLEKELAKTDKNEEEKIRVEEL